MKRNASKSTNTGSITEPGTTAMNHGNIFFFLSLETRYRRSYPVAQIPTPVQDSFGISHP